VVYPVQQEMQHEEERSIRQPFIDMEQKSMHPVFRYRPDDVANHERQCGFDDGLERHRCNSVQGYRRIDDKRREGHRELQKGAKVQVGGDWEPDNWHCIPYRPRSYLFVIESLRNRRCNRDGTNLQVVWPEESSRL